jgi:SAM-dependent methyltransferase
MIDVVSDILACPACGASYGDPRATRGTGVLVCGACAHPVPVVRGIPRFAGTPDTDDARRTQESFGYEWTHFNDWQPSGETNFTDYFAGFDLSSLAGRVVLDAGCGMGRHARQVAPHAGTVVAVDFSAAIEQASKNTAPLGNVACVQADLTRLPLRDGVFDFVYSLGVLHHIADTEGTLAGLVRKVKPGGRLRVYLYWKREGVVGFLLAFATAARLVTTRLPFPVLRVLCWLLSAVLWPLVVLPYKALTAAGVRAIERWPLYVYAKYPFTVLYNDQFDRFSAPIEKRYSPAEVTALLTAAGLTNVSVRPCFGWVADGTRPVEP